MPGMIRKNFLLGAFAISVVALAGSVAVEGLKLTMKSAAPVAAPVDEQAQLIQAIMDADGVSAEQARAMLGLAEQAEIARSDIADAAAAAAGPSDEELARISAEQHVDVETARAIWESLQELSAAGFDERDIRDQRYAMESIVPNKATPHQNAANLMHMKNMQGIENKISEFAKEDFPEEDDATARAKVNAADKLPIQKAIEESKFVSARSQYQEADYKARSLREMAEGLGGVENLGEDEQIALAIAESEREQLLKELLPKELDARNAAAAADAAVRAAPAAPGPSRVPSDEETLEDLMRGIEIALIDETEILDTLKRETGANEAYTLMQRLKENFEHQVRLDGELGKLPMDIFPKDEYLGRVIFKGDALRNADDVRESTPEGLYSAKMFAAILNTMDDYDIVWCDGSCDQAAADIFPMIKKAGTEYVDTLQVVTMWAYTSNLREMNNEAVPIETLRLLFLGDAGARRGSRPASAVTGPPPVAIWA